MDLPKRKPTRLKDYNYSSEGAYFITICTHNRKNLFSDIVGAIHESPEIKLNSKGFIVEKYINQLNTRFALEIDKYVIMPNKNGKKIAFIQNKTEKFNFSVFILN